jgi:hypothetical protein
MKEIIGNIWDAKCDFLCITTNGIVKKDGRLVMGAGIAKEARDRCVDRDLDLYLGNLVKIWGNKVWVTNIDYNGKQIISFPTKHHFKDNSDLTLIEQSCEELATVGLLMNRSEIALPRPGCGCGGLDWEIVKPILEKHLVSDNFLVYSLC